MKLVSMRKRTVVLLVLFFACLLLFQSCAKASNHQAADVHQLCLAFVEKKMTGSGGIFTNYLSLKESSEVAVGHSVLSESQGLMLSYYVRAQKPGKAALTLAFVKEHLDTGKIISYRLDEDGRRYQVNASVDDLRLIDALMEASFTFDKPEYMNQANDYAKRLYDTNVQNGILMDLYDQQYNHTNDIVTLCYADLYTMQELAQHDSRWQAVHDKMKVLVAGGYISDAFPLYQTRYNATKKTYETERVLMVEALLTVYHLSRVESCPQPSIEYLKKLLLEGKLYAVYDQEGNVKDETESTAIYALSALIGASEDDPEMYWTSIERMLAFQVTDPQSPVYGAFANENTLAAYSFDNLLALLALQASQQFESPQSQSTKGDIAQ